LHGHRTSPVVECIHELVRLGGARPHNILPDLGIRLLRVSLLGRRGWRVSLRRVVSCPAIRR
jgi:hypothetical protein